MTQEDRPAELGNSQGKTARVVLRGPRLVKDVSYKLFISTGVVGMEEGLETAYCRLQDGLLWVLHILLDKLLN